eukprot:GEMP01085400.1.p1 GENE.GEMP01085400.1~~GEMP01085400.1.p1  ORF type:complete len:236 (+),score=-30.43 GEMP01085400.1:205-912(+)
MSLLPLRITNKNAGYRVHIYIYAIFLGGGGVVIKDLQNAKNWYGTSTIIFQVNDLNFLHRICCTLLSYKTFFCAIFCNYLSTSHCCAITGFHETIYTKCAQFYAKYEMRYRIHSSILVYLSSFARYNILYHKNIRTVLLIIIGVFLFAFSTLGTLISVVFQTKLISVLNKNDGYSMNDRGIVLNERWMLRCGKKNDVYTKRRLLQSRKKRRLFDKHPPEFRNDAYLWSNKLRLSS